jgi:hypothetical protein
MENSNYTSTPQSTPQSTTHRIATLDEHRQALKYVLKTARERVIIISPSVSRYEMRQDDVAGLVRAAVSRGVVVSVITDDKQNRINGEMKNVARAGFLELLHAGAAVTVLDGIQYKILIKDNNLIVKGNFYWLSAAREGEKVKKAFSVVTGGEAAKTMIEDELRDLQKRERERRPAAEVSIKGQGPERGNRGAKGETQPSWDPASASPGKAVSILTAIVFAGIILLCTSIDRNWKLNVGFPEFFMDVLIFIILTNFIRWKLSGGKKIFEPCDKSDDYLSQPRRSFSDGPSFNVDGTPMISGTMVDIHGNPYGATSNNQY